MAALQFICFLVLVVGCLSLCSYYNARIEMLEDKVDELEVAKEDFKTLERYFYNDYRESVYLKILEVEAINSKVKEKDLLMLERMKRKALKDMNYE